MPPTMALASWRQTLPPKGRRTRAPPPPIASASPVALAVALAVIDPDPRASSIQTARALSAGNQVITGELAGLGRSLLLLILGAGAFFVSIVVLADVLIRRRDLGRRRTLGIGRGDLIVAAGLANLEEGMKVRPYERD